MKTLSAALMTALLVFAIATTWMEVVQPRLDNPTAGRTANGRDVVIKSSARKTPRRIEVEDDELSDEESAALTVKRKAAAKARKESELVEQTKEQLLAQFEDVRKKEARLIEREEALKVIFTDIRRELAEIDEIKRQSEANVAFAERTIAASVANSTEATRQASSPDGPRQTTSNTRPVTESHIANVIKDLAKRGNVKDAAVLLSGLKDTEVSRILASMATTNPTIALKISDQVRTFKLQASRTTAEPR